MDMFSNHVWHQSLVLYAELFSQSKNLCICFFLMMSVSAGGEISLYLYITVFVHVTINSSQLDFVVLIHHCAYHHLYLYIKNGLSKVLIKI